MLVFAACQPEYDYEKKERIDKPACLGITIDGLDGEIALMAPKTRTLPLWINAASISDENLFITIAPNPSKVAEYNRANGTDYEAVPGDAFSITETELILPRYNTSSTQTKLTLLTSAMPDDGLTRVLPLSITKIEGSENISMSAADSTVFVLFRRKQLPASGYELGTGTQADPYIIRNSVEMLCMTRGLKSGQTTYFKLDEDIDMSEEDWAPLNNVAPYDLVVDFDGAGHKLIGFNSAADSNPSLFGVLNGSVHDVIFENPVLTVGASKAGLLGGIVGTADNKAVVSNVTVKNLVINLNGTTEGIGGLAGNALNAEFKDIDMEIKTVDANSDGKLPDSIGGIVGVAITATSTFENINVKGILNTSKRGAGIIGYVKAVDNITVKNCHTNLTINTVGENTAGLLGYVDGQQLLVEKCSTKGSITGAGNYCGGLIGSMAGNSTIKKNFSEVNITLTSGNHIGGLIGNMSRKADIPGSLVEDCYATGFVKQTGGNRMAGGLVGCLENNAKKSIIRRCFASGDVTSAYMQVGGLFAIVKDGTPQTNDIEVTVESCIAWNKVVSNEGAAENNWSSGAIIGVSNIKNTLTNNYRRADMTFKDGSKDNTLCDHENTSPSSPLPCDTPNNKYAYHGKAAAADATLSSVAKLLAWPETVWDLSGDTPKLK